MHLGTPHDEIDIGARFVQESGVFKSALSGADYEDTFAGKTSEVVMVSAVRGKRWRQVAEFLRTPCEWTRAGCDDDSPGIQDLTVIRYQLESVFGTFHLANIPSIQIGNSLLLIPIPIVKKAAERDGLREMISTLGEISIQAERTLRIGNVRCAKRRAKIHARGHVVFPKCHGLPEDTDVESLKGL